MNVERPNFPHWTGGSDRSPPGGGDGIPPDMEHRVAALEKSFEKLDGKIDRLTTIVQDFALKTAERFGAVENKLTAIEGQIALKANRDDLAKVAQSVAGLEGRVGNLPSTSAMITLVLSAVGLSLGGAAGLAFSLFKIFGH